MIEDLFAEELLKTKKKKKKIKPTTIISIAIIVLLLLCFLIVSLIMYLKGTILTITIDNQDASDLKSVFIIQENNKVYIPIRKLGEYFGYETYNGDYITLSEDTNKCYIENQEELIAFTLDSNIITKVIKGQSEQIKLVEPVSKINGELCILAEGAEQAFDFSFTYHTENNTISIETLSYLYNLYANYYVENQNYLKIENENIENKKAVMEGVMIVKGQNGNYGAILIDSQGTTILETKYDQIQYLKNTSDFLVKSNNKMGIISKDQTTKVPLIYENIEKITNKNDMLYIVKKDGYYGLLDSEGQTLIYPEYAQIGINVQAFSTNGVTNGNILCDKVIPVKNNGKWGIYNLENKKITNFTYDDFGCVPKETNTFGVLEIPDYDLIVAEKNNKYYLINPEGKEYFTTTPLDSVYITKSAGGMTYYILYGEKEIDLIDFLHKQEFKKVTEQ